MKPEKLRRKVNRKRSVTAFLYQNGQEEDDAILKVELRNKKRTLRERSISIPKNSEKITLKDVKIGGKNFNLQIQILLGGHGWKKMQL